MSRKRFAVFMALEVLVGALTASPAGAGPCWIDHAAREGNAVKVVFTSNAPSGAITHADGTKTFINNVYFKSLHPVKVAVQNPRGSVILRKGDTLGMIGMDSGCEVTVVHLHGALELKLHYGVPRIPGVEQHMLTAFLPVEGAR